MRLSKILCVKVVANPLGNHLVKMKEVVQCVITVAGASMKVVKVVV